jgi:AraC-like DNA-binding protein
VVSRKGQDRRQRASRDADRRRLEDAAEFYLRACYGTRTAARADEFAAYLALARPYVSRRVAELIGIPLRDFLRERQLAYAQRLLRTTPISVEQVALASAFGTAWTFHRCFKAAFGITPAEYRAGARDEVTKRE